MRPEFSYGDCKALMARHPNLESVEVVLAPFSITVEPHKRLVSTSSWQIIRPIRPNSEPQKPVTVQYSAEWPNDWRILHHLRLSLRDIDAARWLQPEPNCLLHSSHPSVVLESASLTITCKSLVDLPLPSIHCRTPLSLFLHYRGDGSVLGEQLLRLPSPSRALRFVASYDERTPFSKFAHALVQPAFGNFARLSPELRIVLNAAGWATDDTRLELARRPTASFDPETTGPRVLSHIDVVFKKDLDQLTSAKSGNSANLNDLSLSDMLWNPCAPTANDLARVLFHIGGARSTYDLLFDIIDPFGTIDPDEARDERLERYRAVFDAEIQKMMAESEGTGGALDAGKGECAAP